MTARRRVVVHVGLPKTGTTWLQGLLAENRELLRSAGVLSPAPRPGAQFHGAVEVRASHAKFGLDAEAVAGAWELVCARARDFPGTTVLGHEVLAGATPQQVARALAPLDHPDLEVHVVVTARDLGRQAVAHWQEEVKLGDTRSFTDFEAGELRADPGRDPLGRGPDDGGDRPRFWHAQDYAHALARWSSTPVVPPERAHLVVCPPPGAAFHELWARFADACDVDVPMSLGADGKNRSLGAPEVALVRLLNEMADERGIETDRRLRRLKREYAETYLASRDSAPARTPITLRPLLETVTDRWVSEIERAGHPVHGDLADLAPTTGSAGDPPPDVPLPPDLDPEREFRWLFPTPRRRRWLRR